MNEVDQHAYVKYFSTNVVNVLNHIVSQTLNPPTLPPCLTMHAESSCLTSFFKLRKSTLYIFSISCQEHITT
jgi:hypothetical protein